MRAIYTGLAFWNLISLSGFAVLGFLRAGGGGPELRGYQIVALFSAFFCCLVQSLLVAHFIGSMKWIQQSGPTAGIEDTKPLRTQWIKGPMFAVITVAMVSAVAAAILSGAAETGAIPRWIFLTVAVLNVPLNIFALVLARREITATKTRLRGVEAQMQTRIASGDVKREEEALDLLPESGHAGGKVLVFLAANVWVLFVYFKWILRRADEPWWPYAVASGLLFLVGLTMLATQRRDQTPTAP